jgi:hypothetical protein
MPEKPSRLATVIVETPKRVTGMESEAGEADIEKLGISPLLKFAV